MRSTDCLDRYFAVVRDQGLFSSPENLKFYLRYLFENLSFTNKAVLDIGGGAGLFSFYAACMGAEKVVCIEPGAAGSSMAMIRKSDALQSCLENPGHVRIESKKLQDLDFGDARFDILLLHNSVNHLDEVACVDLLHDGRAKESYLEIFKMLSVLANSGATLIITDCSRYNFFASLNLTNPFAPTIEWNKHQSPEFWASLLSEAGFRDARIRWTTFNRLRSLGRLLFANRFASYFLQSHFCLTMQKG